MLFTCPHCSSLIEILGAGAEEEYRCDCGAVLEPDDTAEVDRRAGYSQSALTFAMREG